MKGSFLQELQRYFNNYDGCLERFESWDVLVFAALKLRLVVLPFNSCHSLPQITLLDHYVQEWRGHDWRVILLHEDWHLSKYDIMLNRLNYYKGESIKCHARNMVPLEVDRVLAKNFLEKHHLQGDAKAKYYFGLEQGGEIMAIAGFGPNRLMREPAGFISGELIRYCGKSDIVIRGGLDKLLRHFERKYDVDDIMTYVDRDWGEGESFRKIGFSYKEKKGYLCFSLDDLHGSRSLVRQERKGNQVWSLGSWKMTRNVSKSS